MGHPGAVEPIPDILPILRANPDGTPVVNEFGENVFVGARFDAMGRLLAADDGQLLDDQGGPIRDGSIAELRAATEVFVHGSKARGP